jgi:hypothetical protein
MQLHPTRKKRPLATFRPSTALELYLAIPYWGEILEDLEIGYCDHRVRTRVPRQWKFSTSIRSDLKRSTWPKQMIFSS